MNIQELAKKAGLKVGTNISGVTLVGSPSTPGLAHISIDEMERFAALVLEEAAKVCDAEEKRGQHNMTCDIPKNYEFWNGGAMFAGQLAEEIRALKGAKE